MKEFETSFIEHFSNGLRPESPSRRNEPFLSECHNLRPYPEGLRAYEVLVDPLTGTVIDWPFPQLFIGKKYKLYFTETELYEVAANWSKTKKLETLGSGTRWCVADFYDYILATNGVKIAYLNLAGDTPVWATTTGNSAMPLFGTVCEFRGQLIAGNIKSEWGDCNTNSVIWSRIGYADFSIDTSNESGYYVMPWMGTVQKVKSAGSYFLVYGTNGVMVATTAGDHPGFQWTHLLDVGISQKGAVGDDERAHVFVSQDNELYMIDAGVDLVRRSGVDFKKLGYKEFISELTASEIVITFDPGRREFYISDSERCFMLTQSGMCEVSQLPTSVCYYNGIRYGTFSNTDDSEVRVKTSELDLGIRGLKTLGSVEVSGQFPTDLYVGVDWKNDLSSGFNTGGWVPANPKGVGTPIVTGNELRVKIKSSDYQDVHLGYMKARVKVSDKTNIRGIYGVGQTGKESGN